MKSVVFLFCIAVLHGCVLLGTHTTDTELLIDKAEQAFRYGNFEKSRTLISRGIEVATSVNDSDRSANFHYLLAKVEQATGDYNESIKQADRCLSVIMIEDNPLRTISCTLVLSANYRHKGDYQQARYYLSSITTEIEQQPQNSIKIDYLLVLGALKQAQGQLEEALIDYQKAYTHAQHSNDSYSQARALNNIGGIFRLSSRYSEALESYQQALEIRVKLKDKAGLASLYGNFCNLYLQLRDLKAARQNCKKGLRLAKKTGAQGRHANILNSQAAIYRSQGKLTKATRLYNQSAQLSQSLGDQAGYARSLSNLGEVHFRLQQYSQALDYFQQAITIKQQIEDVYEQAIIWGNIALSYEKLNDAARALEAYHQALVMHSHFNNLEDQWRALANLSRLHEQQSQPQLAVFYGKQAVSRIQKIRTNLTTFSQSQRTSYLNDKRRVYESLANTLIDLGRLYEAQHIMDMLKRDEYLDFIERSADTQAALSEPVFTEREQAQADQYSEISRNLIAIHADYVYLKDKKREYGLQGVDQLRFDQLSVALTEAEIQFNTLISNLSAMFDRAPDLQTDKINEAGLEKLKSIKQTIRQLDRQAALVHFLVTQDRLRIILTLTDSFLAPIHYDSEISRAELNSLIYDFREKLRNRFSDPIPAARALYDVILAPLRSNLDEKNIQLLIVHLDEAMRYIPLAALHDGETYLTDVFKSVIYTSESESKLAFPPQWEWRVAGLGVSQEVLEGFPELPAVQAELDGIVQIEGQVDDEGILPGQIFINEAFTSEQLQYVLADEDNPYKVIHIASHYNHEPGSSSDSFLLTGSGAPLSLKAIKEGDYPMGQVELFALSACETALDVGTADGTEVDGLANTLLYRGVKSVMATLWKVADQSTAQFMQAFYQTRQANQLDKAAVLRSVQQRFLSGQINAQSILINDRGAALLDDENTQNVDPAENYSHPYYWAPFILMGNFR